MRRQIKVWPLNTAFTTCRRHYAGRPYVRLTMPARHLLKIHPNLMNNVSRTSALNRRGVKFTKQSRFVPVLVMRAGGVGLSLHCAPGVQRQ
jgi:hypothetical protein